MPVQKITENTDIILQHNSSLLTNRSNQLLLEQLGISYSQYRLLLQLNETKQINQNMVAINLGQSEASITRQIKILMSKSLIIRLIDPDNRRSRTLKLTNLGIRIKDAAIKIINDSNSELFRSFDRKSIKQFNTYLNQLHSELCSSDHQA
jgi:DNA-binding MarR family transcriptional regulator